MADLNDIADTGWGAWNDLLSAGYSKADAERLLPELVALRSGATVAPEPAPEPMAHGFVPVAGIVAAIVRTLTIEGDRIEDIPGAVASQGVPAAIDAAADLGARVSWSDVYRAYPEIERLAVRRLNQLHAGFTA